MNPQLSIFLNLSRWLAAFLVVTTHARSLVLVDFNLVDDKNSPVALFYLLTSLGHQAVIVFFVISGYLVGGLTWDRWRVGGTNLRSYASARMSRIYTVFVPGLLVGLVIDQLGLHFFNASGLYTADVEIGSIAGAVSSKLGVQVFVGNLFMMQGIAVPTFGSNGPLWSLACEWWYYCIFALIAAACTGRGSMKFAFAVAGVALLVLLPATIVFGGGSIWLMGLAARSWIVSEKWCPAPWLGIGTFLVVLVAGRILSRGHSSSIFFSAQFVSDLAIGAAYAVALAGASRITFKLPFQKTNELLAEFSYSTYVLHFPLLLFLVAFSYQVFGIRFQQQPGVESFFYLISLLFIVYGCCFLCAQLTERHTPSVRKKLDVYIAQRK